MNETIKNQSFKNAFFSAIMVGLIVHFVILSNTMFNHDSITLVATNADWLISQGKWFVTPLQAYKGPVALNYLGNIAGIAAIGCLSGFICSIFCIKNKLYARLIGAILVAFPSVATMMLYNVCDYFALAALLATISAYLITKRDIVSNFLGVILLAFSVGAYQANISFATGILVLYCIILFLNPETSIFLVVKKGLRFIGEIILSLGIYYGILQIRLYMTQTVLSDYKGISSMKSNFALSTLMHSVFGAYKNVLNFLFKDILGTNSSILIGIYIFVIICNFALVILIIWKRRLFREPIRFVYILVLITLIFPLAVNLVGVLSQNTSFYYISIYSFALLFIVAPILIDQLQLKRNKKNGVKIISVFAILSIVLSSGVWFINNNQAYQKLLNINENIRLKSTALVAQIQEQEEFTIDTPIVFVGNTPYPFLENQNGLGLIFDTIPTSNGMALGTAKDEIYMDGILIAYIQNFISPNMKFESLTNFQEENNMQIDEMPIYPNYGSIKYIDGRIVVRMGE